MMKCVFILFLLFLLTLPAYSKEQIPDGFNELVGKTFFVLNPICERAFDHMTWYDEKEGLYYAIWPGKANCDKSLIMFESEDVIITKVDWNKDNAKVWVKGVTDGRKGRVAFRYTSPESFWKLFAMAFDVRAKYSFELASGGLEFTDDVVTATLQPSGEGIGIKIKNNLDGPVKVDWGSGSFVDTNGEAHGIIHSGVKLINKEEYQKPSTIPPKASIVDVIVPNNAVEWVEDHWVYHSLFPEALGNSSSVNGKTVSIFLPLQISGKEDHNLSLPIKVTVINK